jgi:predicted GNAT family N-acyltransferase
MDAKIQKVDAEVVIPLRHEILRKGLPRQTAIFPGDELPTSIHFAAYVDQTVVGCVTLHLSAWEGQPAYQLRGMATVESVRGSGVGKCLLNACKSAAQKAAIQLIWCNARLPAVGFYNKHGWQVVSQEFHIPTAGPHVRMIWAIC